MATDKAEAMQAAGGLDRPLTDDGRRSRSLTWRKPRPVTPDPESAAQALRAVRTPRRRRRAVALAAAVAAAGVAGSCATEPSDGDTTLAAGGLVEENVTTSTTEAPTTTTAEPTTTTTTEPIIVVTAPPTTAPPPPPPTSPPTVAAPPPPPPTAPPPADNCHPSYDPCVPYASDVDCMGGSGNGPEYTGPVSVIGPDIYDLDRDGDGLGCEDS